MGKIVREPDVSHRTAAQNADSLTSRYETHFARYLAPETHAFSFWKGRVALYAILKAMGIGGGDEVILPGFTCVVVPNAVRFAGAKPVFADIAPTTYNLDPTSVEAAITPKTKALIIQHTFGIPAQLTELKSLAAGYHIQVIEDCAHSLGSTFDGRNLGTFGHAAFFSSQWSKPYTTGLGGIATTSDPELGEKLRQIQRQFREPRWASRLRIYIQYAIYQALFYPRVYWLARDLLRRTGRVGLAVASSSESELDGLMPEDHEWRMARLLQGAGLRQLHKVSANLKHRQTLAAFYDEGLNRARWPVADRSNQSVLLRYPLRVQNKNELLQMARQKRIELGSWFDTPLDGISLSKHHLLQYTPGQCPNAEATAAKVVNLPLHPRVTPAEANRILQFFVNFAKQ